MYVLTFYDIFKRAAMKRLYSNKLILIALLATMVCLKRTEAAQSTKNSETSAWKTVSVSDTALAPSIVLRNDSLKVVIYLPQAKNGFYRGSRFDWSGMIGRVTYKNHTFYRHWDFWPHNAENPEHAIGPAEEFDIGNAQEFDKTPVDSAFTKIGVGKLIKKSEHKNYFFNTPYTFALQPPWAILACSTAIVFKQSIPVCKGHVSYNYSKKITLINNSITIHHELKNTSTDTLKSEQFSHNITIIDDDSIGPIYRVLLGFTPTITEELKKACGDLNALSGDTVLFLRKFGGNASGLPFGSPVVKDPKNYATVINSRTKGAVTIGASGTLAKFDLWSRTAICPEPFVPLVVPPGKTVQWDYYIKYHETL